MRIKITPAFISKAPLPQPPADRVIYWDSDHSDAVRGFGLVVTENGARSWCVQYRVGGRARRMHLGDAKSSTLKEARDKAKVIIGQVAAGRLLHKPVDPLEERRQREASEAAKLGSGTLEAIAREFFAIEGLKMRTATRKLRMLERRVFPAFYAKPIGSIRKSELVRLLDRVAEQSGPTAADETLSVLSRIMRWHQARDDEFRSPIVPGLRRPLLRKRERILDDDELRQVWAAAEADNGPVGAFIRFMLLTATRRNESAHMRRSEVSGGIWTIPAARYKTGVDHEVPLSKAAQAVLGAVPRIGAGDVVFTRDGHRALTGFTHAKEQFDKACPLAQPWRFHDLRRTARSLMSRAGVPFDHAERCLGHVMGGVRETYDRHQFLEEKRLAFERLAALVEQIVHPQANVTALKRLPG